MYVSKKAFTLVELLVVIATIALLMSILMPALAAARAQGEAVVCKSNIRQLILANIGYSNENDDFCVPAASDMYPGGKNLHRWHGVRDNKDEPFDPLKGPLVEYLSDGKVKECPGKVRFVKGKKWGGSFEKGCGSYGYNMTYLGSCLWQSGINSLAALIQAYSGTTCVVKVAKPTETLMFADTAFNQKGSLIEYSFAEPPYFVMNGQLLTDMYPLPSIHFRHRGQANIGWSDGHVDSRKKADYKGSNAYNEDFDRMDIGWFEPVDNSLFDLE
jgi:prepilin-type processing-associated H-X9-DG protein/prepilin-type N-terminal cleavage/methylation domain-containing protein